MTRRWMCVLLAAAVLIGACGAEDESTAGDDASVDGGAEETDAASNA